MTAIRFDDPIIIVGGGPVGSTLAIGLAQQGHSVTVLESTPSPDKRWGYDARALAINFGSYRLLERLKIAQGANWEAILRVHASRQGQFGSVDFRAAELMTSALGYTVIARHLGSTLDRCMSACPDVKLQTGTRLDGIEFLPSGVRLMTNKGSMQASLVFACDGSGSTMRQALSIPTSVHDFCQRATLVKVEHEKPHCGTAHERFTAEGVLATLPLAGNQSAIVYVQKCAAAEAAHALDDEQLSTLLNDAFGHRFGAFSCLHDRASYPVVQRMAQIYFRHRCALLGNAAHTLHPVAGQGLNVGFRDVDTLLRMLSRCTELTEEMLLRWAQQRRRDAVMASRLTTAMIKGFSHPLLSPFGGPGLLSLQLAPILKRKLGLYLMVG